jgi:hypothetical protein
MPSKWIRHYDAGIRIEVAGVPVAQQIDALRKLVPSYAELEARHLEIQYFEAKSFEHQRLVVFEAYGVVIQSRSGAFSMMEVPAKAFWDDAIWFTDRQWLESFGLVVSRNTHRTAHCKTCWCVVPLESEACYTCGRFTFEDSFGAKCGLRFGVWDTSKKEAL